MSTEQIEAPPFKFPKECTIFPVTDIDVSGRTRQEYGDVQTLADNIAEVGLIHPPTLSKKGNRLIAGGRRLAAMSGPLRCTHVPVVFRESMPLHMLRELELHENIKRLGMSWIEQCMLIHDVHMLKKKSAIARKKTWFAKETGELMGKSNFHVSHALMVAKQIRANDEEIIKCKSLNDAAKLILKRKADEAITMKAKQTGVLMPEHPSKRTGSGAIEIDLNDPNREAPLGDTGADTPVGSGTTIDFDLSTFKCGDFREVMLDMADGSVDHVVTDIPYGIDMDNLDTFKDIDSIRDTHEVDQNIDMFGDFLEQAYRVINSGFCAFWYDLDHHEKLQTLALKVGFKVQRWPLVWAKTHPCRNSAAEFNFTKATEVAMVLRKGNAVLQKPAVKNWLMADGAAERKKFDHPFIKPFEAWDFILNHVAYKGQKVLDPFAGQMSAPRAFINCGMVPHAIELDPLHFVKGINHVESLVREITNNGARFVNDPRPAAAELIPETPKADSHEEEVNDIEF